MAARKKSQKKSLVSDEMLAELYGKHRKTKSNWQQFVKACKAVGKDTTEQGLRLRLGRIKNKGVDIQPFEGQYSQKSNTKKTDWRESAKIAGVKYVPVPPKDEK